MSAGVATASDTNTKMDFKRFCAYARWPTYSWARKLVSLEGRYLVYENKQAGTQGQKYTYLLFETLEYISLW